MVGSPSPSSTNRGELDQSQGLSSSKPKVRLTCETCRQRKVKCDKLSPCTNCQRYGSVCIPVERARLPRGRSRKTADRPSGPVPELEARMKRLEGMLRDLTRGENSSNHASTTHPGTPLPAAGESYLGNSFWEDLMHQAGNDTTYLNEDLATYETLFMGISGPEALFQSSIEHSTIHRLEEYLCQTFLHQVDPIFKILHRPSLCPFLLEGKPYLHYDLGHPASKALKSAVCYAAACSTSEGQWPSNLGISRKPVIAKYRRETEMALARADFINTDDLTVLQAFVSTRSQDQSRRTWTMLSMALRIAQALSLHVPNPPFSVRPFEQEMRRRLWHTIGVLDVQASLDRASEPMILASWLQSHVPSNINDDDIAYDSEDIQESEGFTDTTFSLIISKAQRVVRSLNSNGLMEPGVEYMHTRYACVSDFQETASRLLRNCQPDILPFHWYTKKVADSIAASLRLIALRPLQRNENFTPPPVHKGSLLKLSIGILQMAHEIYSDPRGGPWRWLNGIFAPWHALAVAIAEICVCDDLGLLERCWPVVEQAFYRFSNLVADSQQGMLWKPMEKLMSRAQSKKEALLGTSPLPVGDVVSGGSLTLGSAFDGLGWTSSMVTATAEGQDNRQQEQTETDGAYSNDNSDLLPNVWDLIDFDCPDADDPCKTSWPSYLEFLAGFQVHGPTPAI
ncbi:hypothetical protein PHISCL_03403 [Aspergillus sclerotialis]|uniref:Zn(2)-C6 fungal-type domain-containing protein n=1 Tax=Aspergillus sclerotialis TaxID=2070753 RepID=A0A3A2ZPR5_9EURO|nr:hypothetical protein PHISCL_03403 [Aspergillus sclerotialis]